jgi:hypothetical protein
VKNIKGEGMKRGQSTIEYLIILAVVIGAIIAASGDIQAGLQRTAASIVKK